MSHSSSEGERVNRALKRAIAKRDAIVAQMQVLYELALRVEREKDVLPLFRARMRDVDTCRTQFSIEQDGILDLLLQLEREEEYQKIHVPVDSLFSEQYYLIRAVSDTFCGSTPIVSNSSANGSHDNLHIQLPKIQLPSFNGDILQWTSFRDTFKSLVHNNSSLTNIEKFHYLLSAVSGSASAVVRSIPLSNSNYEVAWSALNDRFDNERLIMNAHMDVLFSFPPLKSSSLVDLKNFLDTFQENIAALKAFNIPNKEGFMFFYIATRVLDSPTKCLFESQHTNGEIPVIDDLLKFIQTRCQVLLNSSSTSALTPVTNNNSKFLGMKMPRNSLIAASLGVSKSCPMCHGPHYIGRCEKFFKLPVAERLKKIQSQRMCTNCLSTTHSSSKCTSKYACRHCSARHHSLLHLGTNEQKSSSSGIPITLHTPKAGSSSTEQMPPAFVGAVSGSSLSVLGTALIRVRDNYGQWVPVRALIDSGSQISAITHSCASQLGLARRQNNVTLQGLSQSSITQTKGCVTCRFIPHVSTRPEYTCEPIVLSKITSLMPSEVLNPNIRSAYTNLDLADPTFDNPGRVDFLVGADIYNQLFKNGYRVHHETGLPSAFETTLGWILVGATAPSILPSQRVSLSVSSETPLIQLINRFWEIEEPIVHTKPFTEEQRCEENFRQTTTRDEMGRYTVTFPFKTCSPTLGESRSMAVSRFLNLELKLQKDPSLYEEYRLFMEEYIMLGHMKLASTPGKYLLPHHAVVKHVNNKPKLRVVFDASARTSSGKSLNDLLYTGPKLQCDIMDLLVRCRLKRYMFTADICKMYRQINISSSEREYQHILWRSDPSKSLLEYTLTTVTYGVASAPFQAIRVLHQLEIDEGDHFPAAQGVLSNQTYVDDIITGENTVNKVLLLQKQIIQLLARGGFVLKKWASNCPEALKNIPFEDCTNRISFDPKDDCSVKILGLHWEPLSDTFSYHTDSFVSPPTKRSVLSAIAKIYDPLGILAPITFWAKCFMQTIWKNKYEWDSPISENLASVWKLFSDELLHVSSIKIPRHIPVDQCCDVQLLGFSDASLKGFAAVVYIRLSYSAKPATIHLITAKSKVAPLKFGNLDAKLSVPRLELCGALLLAQTLHRVHNTIFSTVKPSAIHAWTDSTVVLSWLTTSQVNFKVFVTNRLSKISELLPSCNWHHVPSTENPADCVSRGMLPQEASLHNLYWKGPKFLKEPMDCWSTSTFQPIPADQLPEQKASSVAIHLLTTPSVDTSWLKRFSSVTRLQRTFAYVRRFILKTRRLPSYSGFLRRTELDEALKTLIRPIQSQEFQKLFKYLSTPAENIIPRSLARLSPFVDDEGIIRVGGRLRYADASEEFKFPILLPKSCTLSTLLIRHYHLQYLHAGPQLVASLLSARYWIVSSRSAIRSVLFKCVSCARHKASQPPPIMGDLPVSRVRGIRPFHSVGIDYAGPLLLKEGYRKNARSIKCYLAIFVCMAIKAVHIEVVSSLTTDAFLAALNRFVSRRGIPAQIFSDCGTNFRGADQTLRCLFSSSASQSLFSNAIPCEWHFNPPASPHFGGLWEAAVKSTKFHLKRVIGTQILTFEEMCTLTHRIEAVLNSRPLTPQSADPNDLHALTPGHFLIGCPILAIPEPDHTTEKINRLTRWQLLNQMHQSFWNRWSAEYLTTLQSRAKWYRKQTNLMVGDLVLLAASNVPPTLWKLGRIEATHPGGDGVVRVVTVRTADGTYKRPVVKLAVLPIHKASSP